MNLVPILNIVALLCTLLIGFAAHRASLCNVRAVAEVMTGGSLHMFWSLMQAVIWMITLTGVLVLIFGISVQPVWARTPMGWALVGGWLFGVGAAVNGGCSLSTLHRLVDGELGMLATLVSFSLGVAGWGLVRAPGWAAGLSPAMVPWYRWPDLAPWLLAILLFWTVFRLRLFAQLDRQHAKTNLRARILAPAYHLSVSAAVMGLAGGLLYATQGAWSYTNFIRMSVMHRLGSADAPAIWHAVLVLGMLGGMLVSALQRRSPVWRWPARWRTWARHVGGGALMGAGASMVPGGNDTLLLVGLPAVTATAIGAYAFMLIGIASVLWSMRLARAPMSLIACTESGCDELPSQSSGSPKT